MLRIRNFIAVTVVIAALFLPACSGKTTQPSPQGASVTSGKKIAKVLAQDLQITTDPNDQASPSVAYDTLNNRFFTVWTDYRNTNPNTGNTDIYGSLCTGSGSGAATVMTCAADFPITIAPGGQSEPRVAYSSDDNKYLVVWTDASSGTGKIVGQFVTVNGALQGTQFDISTVTASDISQSSPDLIYNPVKKKFVVAWLDISDFDQSSIITLRGAPCSNSINIGIIPLPFSDNNLIRTIEVNPATGVTANKKDYSQYFNTGGLSDSGTSMTTSWNVMVNEANPKLTYDTVTGEYFVAWNGRDRAVKLQVDYTPPTAPATACVYKSATFTSTENDSVEKIKIRRFPPLGLISDLSFGTLQSLKPTLATDSNLRRTLVAWEENQQITGRLIDIASFTAVGPAIDISSGTGARTSPVSAFDNVNQRYLVAWEDARNLSANLSNIDIFGQFVDPQGNLSGGNAIISAASGNQLSPAIAFGDVDFRQFMTVFSDGRSPGNKDIYAQLLEFSVSPQLVITDSANNPITSGAIDFGSIAVGSTKDVNFTLRNDGNTQLTINSVNLPSAPYTLLTPTPVTISPGTNYPMTVRFAPVAAGSYAGTAGNTFQIAFNSDGGNSTIFFSGSGVGNNPLSVTTTTLSDVAIGSPYSVTLAATGGVFPFAWGSSSLPPGLTFNASTGVLSGTPTTGGTYSIVFTVSDNSSPIKLQSSRTLTLNVGVVTITNSILKNWTMGVEYGNTPRQTLAGIGLVPPVTWSVLTGNLPPGILLNSSSGDFTGAPTASGNYTFTVKVVDSLSQSATKDLSITVNPQLSFITAALPSATVGTQYSQSIQTAGGTAPTTMTISSGALPPGLSFDGGTGAITGIPSSAGTYAFTALLADSTGASLSNGYSVTVANQSSPGGGGSGTVITGPDNTVPTSGGRSGCFIATAAYGSYLDPHVMVLRNFRDKVLLKSEAGRSFVAFYYRTSPPIADFIGKHSVLRLLTRWALTPLIFAASYPVFFGIFVVLAGLISTWTLRKVRHQDAESIQSVG